MNDRKFFRRDRVYLAIFLMVLAPLAAVIVVSALLLFGVHPQTVFAPGRFVKSFFDARGFHVPRGVAVAGTVFLWWALFAALGFAWERVHARA
jgi:hypothetical protein